MSDENQNQQLQIVNDHADCAQAPVLEMPRDVAMTAVEELGLGTVPRKAIQELSKIGVEADSFGLISIAGGALVLTAPALVELLNEVVKVSRKTKSDQKKISCAIAGAALGKAIQGIATSVKADGLASQANKPKVRPGPKRTLGVVTSTSPQSSVAA